MHYTTCQFPRILPHPPHPSQLMASWLRLNSSISFHSLIYSLTSTAFIAHRSFQIGGKLLGFPSHHVWNS